LQRLTGNIAFVSSYRQDLPQAALSVSSYSRAGFGVFRPAGATRCTDQSEIWQRGAVRSSLPNFTLIGSEVWVYGPQNVKKLNFTNTIITP